MYLTKLLQQYFLYYEGPVLIQKHQIELNSNIFQVHDLYLKYV